MSALVLDRGLRVTHGWQRAWFLWNEPSAQPSLAGNRQEVRLGLRCVDDRLRHVNHSARARLVELLVRIAQILEFGEQVIPKVLDLVLHCVSLIDG